MYSLFNFNFFSNSLISCSSTNFPDEECQVQNEGEMSWHTINSLEFNSVLPYVVEIFLIDIVERSLIFFGGKETLKFS